MNDIDVLVPTLRRPEQLLRALTSVLRQESAAELISTVVVVDNSPEGSAAGVVERLRAASPMRLLYVHEPHPGIATARNSGLAATSAPLVAFLDDDEDAPPGWLGELRAVHLRLGAAVTFGPVRGLAPDARPEVRPYLDRFFSRIGPEQAGWTEIAYGCGNSMMTRAVALAGPEPFDARSDLTGGEDDRLFSKLRREGLRFGWAPRAWVHEYAPAHRSRVRYAFKRAFCYGQSPSQTSLREGRWLDLCRNMAIGAGQAGVYGAMGLVLLAAGRQGAAVERLDGAVRGLGKVFWPLRIELYGLKSCQPGGGPAARPAPAARAEVGLAA